MAAGTARAFVYLHSSDLVASRDFYGQVLGLEQVADSDELIGYRHGSLQITVELDPDALTQHGWSRQLGWRGGVNVTPSLGFEFPTTAFPAVVNRSRQVDIPAYFSEPQWVGYWSFPIKDPSGNTVEVSAIERRAWPGEDDGLTT